MSNRALDGAVDPLHASVCMAPNETNEIGGSQLQYEY
jgi:hypothetical protein